MQAEEKDVTRLLKTARGQLDGLIRMVEEDRYCIDISNQLMATGAILKKINLEVLEAHVHSCVMEAMNSEDNEEKMEEIIMVMKKLSK